MKAPQERCPTEIRNQLSAKWFGAVAEPSRNNGEQKNQQLKDY
jgi:hypothetical protein